ncbi:MAG: nuclear transport factor 2 family protein [Caulobacteraceae bacterium]|nr:nuclear transport factor 2 family protein [Caulobacteraceae bacterium]
MDAELAARLDRVESTLAIQQLPVRYAMALDARDSHAWASLFIEDVNCGRHGVGRDTLRQWIERGMATFYRSMHQICGHKIDFTDADHATGQVYCRAEHEDNGKWIVMAICYFDTYERRSGEWLFVRRKERHWYSQDIAERPTAPFDNWPGKEQPPTLPAAFPTWAGFWRDVDEAQIGRLTSAPVHAGG